MTFKSHLFTCIHRVAVWQRVSLSHLLPTRCWCVQHLSQMKLIPWFWKGSNCGKPVPGQQATLCPHVVWGHVVPCMASESIFSTCACESLCAQTHTPKPNILHFYIAVFKPPGCKQRRQRLFVPCVQLDCDTVYPYCNTEGSHTLNFDCVRYTCQLIGVRGTICLINSILKNCFARTVQLITVYFGFGLCMHISITAHRPLCVFGN